MLASGLWGLGSNAYGEFEDQYSESVIERQIDKGITLFDTSDSYGNGRSEKLLGNVIQKMNCRNKVKIATKVGLLPHSGFYMPWNFSIEHVEKKLNLSLKNLKTNYIDIYQLHSPEINSLKQIENVFPFLIKKKESGEIKNIGISARSPQDALFFVEKFDLDFIQVNFNLIDQRLIQSGLLEKCVSLGIKVLARTPLAFGFLTGKLTSSKDQFSKDDHRYKWPQEQLDIWASAFKKFEIIRNESELSPLSLAHQYIKSFEPNIYATITGMHSIKELYENLYSYYEAKKLNEEQLNTIEKTYKNNTFFIKGIKSKGPQ